MSSPPKKYIKNTAGRMVLNPAYREWKNNLNASPAPVATVTETPIAEAYYFEEEGAEEINAAEAVGRPDYGVGSKEVIEGKYVVPKGVAVEMMKNFNGKKDLLNDCPHDVRVLMESKGAFQVYERFVQAIYDDKNNKNALGRWKDSEFVSLIDAFRDDFADKGIKVALCARFSGDGNKRWLEFIDVSQVGNYVPQYDLGNLSGQTISTFYTTLHFPNGVCVEELKQWGGRNKIQTRAPWKVQLMMDKFDLNEEYNAMVKEFVTACAGKTVFKNWDIEKLKVLVDKHDDVFVKKGIDLFVSHKQEWVSHGKGGHYEYYRWIEFVDMQLQPNYLPQRDADDNDEKGCSIM